MVLKLFSVLTIIATLSLSQYSYRTEHLGVAQRAGENNTFRASLLKDGRVLHTIERTLPFDVPYPSTYVNEETGSIVLCFIFDGFVEMYDATGDKIWEQNFFKEREPNYERTIGVALGKTTVAFLTSDVYLPNAKVHLFAVNGAKQWERELPHPMGYEIAMSPDEKTIVAGSYLVSGNTVRKSASLFTSAGIQTGDIDILFRKAVFSDDNRLLALISERELVTVSMETKKEIGRIAKQREKTIFTDVCWNGNSFVVQESEVVFHREKRYYYASPSFTWYSTDMVKQAERQLDNITYQRSQLVPSTQGVEFRYDLQKIILQQ
ncbi:MAG: hypothetical protein HYV29_12240 [Ignavibacteriales bacterium]|nr:hypothetical protein [Ignavibacteriales bacterium]